MRYLRLDLLTLLISLFIFTSCQKSETVSLDTNYDQAINGKRTDSSTVLTSTVKEADSVTTSGLSQHPFGYFNDPVLGTTEANLALNLTLPSDALSFGTAPILDSAVLVLKYGDEMYGDSLSTAYTVHVKQLAEPFRSDVVYSSAKEWASGQELGSKLVRSFPWRDSVDVTQVIKGARDTSKRLAPQLRIKLDKDLITQKILNAGSSNLATSGAFRTYFKGLYLTMDQNLPSGNKGALTFFDLQTTLVSKLELYYKNTTTTGTTTTTDTTVVSFPISSGLAASTIRHNYPTAILNKLNKVSDEFYVQGLAGLRGKINLPYLSLLEKNGEIAVNKAELVVSVVGGTDASYKPAKRLVLYRTDIAGQRQAVPDYSPSVIGAIYDSVKKRYVFNISSYVQSVLNKKLEQYDLYIAPIDYSAGTSGPNISSSSTATTAMRSVLGGKDNPSYKVKLNVYYTKPD